MKIHTLGTGSGTQPVKNYHHVCTAIETETALYFIDAGENGAYAAHLEGIDLLKTRAVFITHPHMDHVGGLGNLLWYIRKMCIVNKTELAGVNIDVCSPEKDVFDATMLLLKNTEGDFQCAHTHSFVKIDEQLDYTSANGELKLKAVHTDHIPPRNGEYRSYAFIITLEGKKLLFMGDMRLEDIPRCVPADGVDLLAAETGHYGADKVAEAVKGLKVGTLFFTHHGKSTRDGLEEARKTAENITGLKVITAEEGACYIL